MSPTRSQHKADTREAVLGAARVLFAERGYEATTLAAVARRAGVAVGTVYVHFPDKPTLLTEALHDDLGRVIAAAMATLPADGARAQLRHLVGALFGYYAAHLALSRVLVKESLLAPLHPGGPPDAVLSGFLATLGRVLADGGALAPGVSPRQGAGVFFGLYLVALIGGLRGETFDVEAQLAVLDGLLDAALFAGGGDPTRQEVGHG